MLFAVLSKKKISGNLCWSPEISCSRLVFYFTVLLTGASSIPCLLFIFFNGSLRYLRVAADNGPRRLSPVDVNNMLSLCSMSIASETQNIVGFRSFAGLLTFLKYSKLDTNERCYGFIMLIQAVL